MKLMQRLSFVFLCAGFVAGNYARVLSGPHKGLQGKVGTCMCITIIIHQHVHVCIGTCMCIYMYVYMHMHVCTCTYKKSTVD